MAMCGGALRRSQEAARCFCGRRPLRVVHRFGLLGCRDALEHGFPCREEGVDALFGGSPEAEEKRLTGVGTDSLIIDGEITVGGGNPND